VMSVVQESSGLKSFTTNDLVKIVYRQAGSTGPVVILLHGKYGKLQPQSEQGLHEHATISRVLSMLHA